MTGEVAKRFRFTEHPLLVGLSTAILASGVGVAVNVATELVRNPLAWAAVVVLTAASGSSAAWISKGQLANQSEVVEEDVREDIPRRHRSEKRSTSRRVSRGVVKRMTIEIRPDGTRLKTIEFFSEELAREDTGVID